MTTPIFQALIVDDEPISCKMMTFALAQESFSCDAAKDGEEALRFCRHRDYDLVVTDLVMPNRNGHSLAVDLLAAKSHPVVVIHTSVNEPRLTKDLLARGVDEVVYKPTNYKALAARVAATVAERKKQAAKNATSDADNGINPVEVADFEIQARKLASSRPLSQAALTLYGLADADEILPSQVAECLAPDAGLSAEAVRLADVFYRRNNPDGKDIADLETAVVRLGHKRVAHLAIGYHLFKVLTANPGPWLNVDLAWRRSIATAAAMDTILTRGVYSGIGGGLFLDALMHLFGRIALGLLYPTQYRKFTHEYKLAKGSLDEIEERMFPLSHGQILGSLFKIWNLPNALCLPFNFVSKPFSALVSLSEPMRTKVELLKLSIMIGQIALGEWEAWDAIDFPTSSVLKRLQLESIAKIIEDTRAEMKILFGEQCDGEQANNAQTAEPAQPEIKKSLGYCNLSAETFDFLRAIVATMGIDLTECVPNILEPNRNFLVNCLWNPPQKFNSIFSPGKPCYGAKLMVADPNHVTFYESAGKVITLPTNFGTLQSACDEIARHE